MGAQRAVYGKGPPFGLVFLNLQHSEEFVLLLHVNMCMTYHTPKRLLWLGLPPSFGSKLKNAGRSEAQPLILAATKSNIGHLEGAALPGAGFIFERPSSPVDAIRVCLGVYCPHAFFFFGGGCFERRCAILEGMDVGELCPSCSPPKVGSVQSVVLTNRGID